jgi:hypothetical protein
MGINMNKTSIAVFIGSLLLGIGGWMATLSTWGVALAPGTLSGLILIIGGVIVNWFNKSPLGDNSNKQ